jgi:ankyrin repeat protein
MLPLHLAIEHMDEPKIAALLDQAADFNQADPDIGGFRPLHLSVDIECEDSCRRYDGGDEQAQPHARITSLLLKAGADPDLPATNGQSARDLARERNHVVALKLFNKDAQPGNPAEA